MQLTLTVFLKGKTWYVTDNSPETYSLFKTNTIQTPFMSPMTFEEVESELQKRNPKAIITLKP